MEALGINGAGLLAQLINFALLLIILRAVAYKPIMNMLDQRAARIKESMDNAERVKEQLAKAQEDYAAMVEQARKDSQSIINQANQIGERIRQESQEAAHREAGEFLAKAHAQIERDKRQAVAELRKEVGDLAILAASKIVARSLDGESHRRLIEETLNESDKLSSN
ncbi:MAG: F0F1 ATP synthase subunit B [Dehalococcoidales bacterium]|nr:F0F1 ATP synthase subunit B [Dehalococcoidales bacterium]